jgi:prepilin-type N-terminal cleavage/methylation domain-containing protein
MRRAGVSLIELVVVLGIIAILLGLVSVAASYAREAARRAQCQSNLRQLAIALTEYVDLHKQVPDVPPPGTIGGWTLGVLPFMEESALADGLAQSPSLAAGTISPLANTRPQVMTCPDGFDGQNLTAEVPPTHYVLTVINSRRLPKLSWVIEDSYLGELRPWPSGPEVQITTMGQTPSGPHSGGWNRIEGNSRSGNEFGVRLVLPSDGG